jgi:hypothetical protein
VDKRENGREGGGGGHSAQLEKMNNEVGKYNKHKKRGHRNRQNYGNRTAGGFVTADDMLGGGGGINGFFFI